MAPKGDSTPSKAVVSTEAFLAACIKHAKEKVIVDYNALGQELGMSSGGAANKYRALMKGFEQEGAAWARNSGDSASNPGTPAKSTPAKRKASAKAKSNVDDDKVPNGEGVSETPTKKIKSTARQPKTVPGVPLKAKKLASKIKDESDGEEIAVAKPHAVEVQGESDGEGSMVTKASAPKVKDENDEEDSCIEEAIVGKKEKAQNSADGAEAVDGEKEVGN